MKTLPLGPFLGINNRLPDFGLHVKDKGDYLRVAENVDVTNRGNLVRRKAATLVQAMTSPHSMHGSYLVRASALYRITLPTYSETLVKVLASNAAMSYAEFNGDLYFSNGTDSGRIAADGTVYPWGMLTPDAPAVATIPGALFKGAYQVSVGYVNSVTGEEGGVSASTKHNLPANSALRVTLPGSVPGATHINVYVSTVNGSIPKFQATVAVGTASVDVTVLTGGREAAQRYEAPLPAGTRIFEFNGQLCSVAGKDLFYGIPYRPGYYLPVEGRIPFPEDISVAVGNQNGVYVAADKTYFFPGTQLVQAEDAAIVRDVLPYGATEGTEFRVPNKPVVGWFGAKGIVLADDQGQVTAMMEDSIDLTPPISGTSTVFESGGYRRVVSCGWCVNLENGAATTYTGYDFTSTSGGYGTKADGIYLLEGTGKVDAAVGLGKQDFGAENLKHLPAVYVGGSSDEPLELGVVTPDGNDWRYLARSCSDVPRVHRIDPGKGLRDNWYDLSIRNTGGSDFTLASVSFAPVASGRRI